MYSALALHGALQGHNIRQIPTPKSLQSKIRPKEATGGGGGEESKAKKGRVMWCLDQISFRVLN